jgi:hypothetical protein
MGGGGLVWESGFLEDEGRRRGFGKKRKMGVLGRSAVGWYGGEWPEMVSRWWGGVGRRWVAGFWI